MSVGRTPVANLFPPHNFRRLRRRHRRSRRGYGNHRQLLTRRPLGQDKLPPPAADAAGGVRAQRARRLLQSHPPARSLNRQRRLQSPARPPTPVPDVLRPAHVTVRVVASRRGRRRRRHHHPVRLADDDEAKLPITAPRAVSSGSRRTRRHRWLTPQLVRLRVPAPPLPLRRQQRLPSRNAPLASYNGTVRRERDAARRRTTRVVPLPGPRARDRRNTTGVIRRSPSVGQEVKEMERGGLLRPAARSSELR